MSVIVKATRAAAVPCPPAVLHMPDLALKARRVIDAARQQAAEILREARDRAHDLQRQAREQGHAEGSQAGLEEGRQRGQAQAYQEAQAAYERDLKHLAETLASICRDISAQRERRLQAAEQDLLDLAIDIARRVTKLIGQTRRDVAPANLRSALATVVKRTRFQVEVHPDDLSAVHRFDKELAETMSQQPHLTFVGDPQMSRGGVLLRSEDTEFDATLDQQLDSIAELLTETGP